MSDRTEPSHDRLVLTQAERRVLADLERDLDGTAAAIGRPGWRCRMLALYHRWMPLGPLLLPAGVVLMLWTLTSSLLASSLGAVLMALGLAACLRHPWLGRRRRQGQGQGQGQGRITP